MTGWLVRQGYVAGDPLSFIAQLATIWTETALLLAWTDERRFWRGLVLVHPPAYLPRHSRRR